MFPTFWDAYTSLKLREKCTAQLLEQTEALRNSFALMILQQFSFTPVSNKTNHNTIKHSNDSRAAKSQATASE